MSGLKGTDWNQIQKIKIKLESCNEIEKFIEDLISLPASIKGYEIVDKKILEN